MTINTANMYVTESNNEMAGTPQQYKPITVGPGHRIRYTEGRLE